MRSRPILPLSIVAAFMVVWMWIRMWWGTETSVWTVSCVIGAWAPIGAAAVFLYLRAVGDREHSVWGAWLARAVGMHCVLVWMLGASDWLRGPPGHPSHWDPDLGAPVVLLSFFPIFGVATCALNWVLSVSRRLINPVMRPAMPHEKSRLDAAFRTVPLVKAGSPLARVPMAPFVVAAIGCLMASGALSAPNWVPALCLLPLAAATAKNHRALGPSIATLVGLMAVVLGRRAAEGGSAMTLAMAWPWLALVSVGFYLAAVEALIRTRLRPARQTAPRPRPRR